MKTFSFWMTVAIALVFSSYVWAADEATGTTQPAKQQQPLKAADTNGDGKISFEEIKAVRPKITQEIFDKIDTNKDGFLIPEELRAAKAAKEGTKSRIDQTGPQEKQGKQGKAALTEKLRDADKNGDGKVTFEELQGAMPKVTQEQFARFDRNKDGVITKEDRATDNERGGDRERSAGRMKEADTNGDKKISFEEAQKAFPKMTEAQFKKRDTNGDGFLSKEDRKNTTK